MRGTRPPPPAGSGAAPPGISGSALRLGLRRGARQAAAAAAARRGGGTGGGRGRGTVGLGRLSLYLLLLPSCLALTLPLSFSPPLFPAASGYRFPSFYRYDLGFESLFIFSLAGFTFYYSAAAVFPWRAVTAVKAARFATLVSSPLLHCPRDPTYVGPTCQ